MGFSAWSSTTYGTRSADYSTKSRDQIFQKSSIRKDFDPKNITMRESCDSEAHPESTALIFGLDVTGSMGFIAEKIAKEGLGTLVNGILDSKPVTDPHLMMMAIGDIYHDSHPLQVSQFECDIAIVDQLVDLHLEGGGGGNHFESYDLPWAFAASKTKIDCFEKRGKKGYLFTMGDEMPPDTAKRDVLKREINLDYQTDPSSAELLANAQVMYNVFHVIVEEGSYCRRESTRVYNSWKKLLGKKTILLDNCDHISEVIISVISVNEGENPDDVINKWDNNSIKESVRRALYGPNDQ